MIQTGVANPAAGAMLREFDNGVVLPQVSVAGDARAESARKSLGDTIHIADQVLTASTALAGLLLVFISGTVLGFVSLKERTEAARYRFRRAARLSFWAFTAAILAALLALQAYWFGSAILVMCGAALFVLSAISSVALAYFAVRLIPGRSERKSE